MEPIKLSQLLALRTGPVEQKRVIIASIEGRSYPFSVHWASDAPPVLSIPDPGGQMDMVPRYPEQFRWTVEKFGTLEGFDSTWGTSWALTTPTSIERVLDELTAAGYLEQASFSTDAPEPMAMLLGLVPYQTLIDDGLFMVFLMLNLACVPDPTGAEALDWTITAWYRRSDARMTLDCGLGSARTATVQAVRAWLVGTVPNLEDVELRTLRGEEQLHATTLPVIFDTLSGVLRGLHPAIIRQCYLGIHFREPL